MKRSLYLALAEGENFGWGVCSQYLAQELRKMYRDVHVVGENTPATVSGTVIHALADLDFNPLHSVRGERNFGYTFFENELTAASVGNSGRYDCVLAGSTWCCEKLREKGVNNCEVLMQGIDPTIFSPLPSEKDDSLFVLFSGGKFELRKGQDLVLRAFKILQDKYPDIILINCWYNAWPQTMAMLQHSRYITFEAKGNTWKEFMNNLYMINGIDPGRVVTMELVDHHQLPEVYAKTDIGVFPNRCEGGTNLVLMEYMACAKPVIASFTSGHTDILRPENALLLDDLAPYQIYDQENRLWADWREPSVDQLVAMIEFAYMNRQAMREKGQQAGQDLQHFTWTHSARSLLNTVEKYDGLVG